MELYIAGGAGEHGRNCFMVCYDDISFLVDCGIMAGDKEPYPHLTETQIKSAKYLFLTHSHADHCGALEWLYFQGFDGLVISSEHTLAQMKYRPKRMLTLERVSGNINGLQILWGRSGHCTGSVWYRFERNGSSIFFTGDYTENTLVYRCDKIRGITADMAVIDCAYGNDTTSYDEYCRTLTERTLQLSDKYSALIFPVPKYGRGEEIITLLAENKIKADFYGDEHFISRMSDKNTLWKKARTNLPQISPIARAGKGIYFISSPQLNDPKSADFTERLISLGGYAVMTGTVEKGSVSEAIIKSGRGEFIRYPVHQGINEYNALCKNNFFRCVTAYHSSEL